MPDFETLANRHKDAVYRQMVRVCGNHEDAEDVLAEALLRAYRFLDQLEDKEHFRAWLATIGRRVCTRLKKKEALAPIIALADLPDVPAPDPEPELDLPTLKKAVQDAVDSLPKPYQEVYQLRDLQNLSGEDTAARLGISIPAMKSRLHRARTLVRQALTTCVGCPQPN